MARRFNIGDSVETVTGMEGEVILTDSARNLVAVRATNSWVGHDKGDERVFHGPEVRKV